MSEALLEAQSSSHSVAPLRVTEDSDVRKVLGPEQAYGLTRGLERIARFRDMLEYLQDSKRRLVEQLNINMVAALWPIAE